MRILFLILVMIINISAMAQQKQVISVFKNGSAFFSKKVDVDNTGIINELPDALFGTIWFSNENNNILSVSSKFASMKEKAGNLFQLLKANTGKKIKLTLNSGEIIDATVEKAESSYILLRTKEGWKSVVDTNIRSIDFFEQPTDEFIKNDAKRVIQLHFSKPNPSPEVDLMYMTKNIGWVPCYKINLKDEKTASLQLTANFINDAEDITNAKLSLVVGVPSFAYNFLRSPVTSTQTLNDFLNALAGGNNNNNLRKGDVALTNIITQSFSQAGEAYNSGDDETMGNNFAEMSNSEDLYFYQIPSNVTLKKGDRAVYDLLNADVQYEHVYEVNLDPGTAQRIYYFDYGENESKGKEVPSKVWHYIRFKNTTTQPLTTGTAMVLKTEPGTIRPISQDKLDYTVVGGKAKVKLTISSDIEVLGSEVEKSREEKNKMENSYYYDLITAEAKIKIKNYKTTAVKLDVNRMVMGDMISSDHKWNVTKEITANSIVSNKKNTVKWEVELKPGESKEIKYQYKFYTRR